MPGRLSQGLQAGGETGAENAALVPLLQDFRKQSGLDSVRDPVNCSTITAERRKNEAHDASPESKIEGSSRGAAERNRTFIPAGLPEILCVPAENSHFLGKLRYVVLTIARRKHSFVPLVNQQESRGCARAGATQ